jgi:hypothetical protein
VSRHPRLDTTTFAQLRVSPCATVGFMLTDRCPVGCSHCSVDSTSTSLGPKSIEEQCERVATLTADDRVRALVITGGEPFAHPKALLAVLRRANGRVYRAVHTSAYWGRRSESGLYAQILQNIDTLLIGVDTFHSERIPRDAVVSALRAAHAGGCWVVLQALDLPVGPASPHVELAEAIALEAFGEEWRRAAEIMPIPPIAAGRASMDGRFSKATRPGACGLAHGPILRHDGTLTACCNERVVLGAGPAALRTEVGDDVPSALARLEAAPLVRMVRSLPPNEVLELAESMTGVPSPTSQDTCSACWALGALLETLSEPQLRRLAALVSIASHAGVT